MSKKGGLGKGLGAIFGENTSPAVEKVQEPASAAQELLIKNIAANPYQPRCNFDEEKLQELAASIKEYAKCIERFLTEKDRYITITFCEKSGDKLVTKGTYAKMARGEMVRYMAEKQIENPTQIQGFDRLGYVFREELSSESEYVFERVNS